MIVTSNLLEIRIVLSLKHLNPEITQDNLLGVRQVGLISWDFVTSRSVYLTSKIIYITKIFHNSFT